VRDFRETPIAAACEAPETAVHMRMHDRDRGEEGREGGGVSLQCAVRAKGRLERATIFPSFRRVRTCDTQTSA